MSMTSAHHKSSSGSQGGIALILAIAAFAVSVFLWTGSASDTSLPETTARSAAASAQTR
jgi:hypothetical protein